MNWKQTLIAIVVMAQIAILPACKPDKSPINVEPTITPAKNQLKFQALNVGKQVSADQSVAPLTLFTPEDKIIASILTLEASTATPVSARLIAMSNGQVLSELSRKVTTTGPATTNFEFPNPSAWTLGRYQVEAAINGKLQARQEIEVSQDGPPTPPSETPPVEKRKADKKSSP